MRGQRCLLNSRRAIPRVLSSSSTQQALRQLHPWLQPRSQTLLNTFCPSRIRLLSASAPQWKKKDTRDDAEQKDKEEIIDTRWTTQATLEKSGRERWPWDYEITDPQIMVYDNGSIEGPLKTAFVLTKIAPHESLRMVTPYEPADPKRGTPPKYPLCKIVEKDAEFKKKRELETQKKEQKVKDRGGKAKEFEINWASSDHDTATKLKRIEGVLAKGYQVLVILTAPKKKGKKRDLSDIDFNMVMKKVREGVEAAGGKEKKKPEGEVGDTIRIVYEPDPNRQHAARG